MIILKHLTVERFRLLRELNLHFPQRGSILIQGPNEAGKSALLESIYFALYGEPLTSGRSLRSLDELIFYGASNAIVTLTLSIGATELAITRVIERGQGQRVSLQIHRLGLAPEELTDMQKANARIIAEIGGIDGASLRNSCLVEQKGLARLEHIAGAERETTMRKLLGLEQMESLSKRFSVQPEDEQRLQEASQYLHLAELQHHIPEVSKRLEEIEVALDAVTVHEQLEDIKLQEADIAEQEQALSEIEQRRLELRNKASRGQQLQKADAVLSEIITSYDKIAEAQREVPNLEGQIADLELREREDLPELQGRVNELAELSQSFGTLQRMSNDLLASVDSIKGVEQEYKQYERAQNELRQLNEQVARARASLAQSQQALTDLKEGHRTERPNHEQRLERMRFLDERLGELQRLEEQYNHHLAGRSQAEENRDQLDKLSSEISVAEQESSLLEAEAGQIQQRADIVERHWRQASVRHHLEDWHRLMTLQQGLVQAEQRLSQARQQYAEYDRSFLKS
ncbi:MAG TPA: AAA family ATPase, partial [Ktedonobacteraceae bacterium]